MSLLLDAAFLRDRLRLAALSTQDAPAENVIKLDLHARHDLHAPTSPLPATPRLPQPLATLGHGLGPPAAAPPAHAAVADRLVHDNSPPAALELLLRQAESDGNRQRRRSKVVSINTAWQANAVARSPPPLPVPKAAAVASMIKPPDRRASLYVRDRGNGTLPPATETATVATAAQPAANAPGTNAVTPANQLSAAPVPPADLDAQSLPPADSPPRHPLPPPTLVARSLALTMSVDPDDDMAEVYGYDDVVAADNDDDDNDDDDDDQDQSDEDNYGSGVAAVSDTGADPGNGVSADRASQIEQRRGPGPGPGENASVEVHIEGDGTRNHAAPSVPDPVSLGDPASFDAILAQMEALARAQAMAPPDIFIRRPVAPKSAVTAQRSQLSAVLNAQSPQANPFAATYARYDGQHAKESMNLRVLIPFARAPPASDASANADAALTKTASAAPAPAPSYAQRRRRGPPPPAAPPRGIPLDVHVCRSATVEQVIGYVLYLYVARGFEPTLDHPYHHDVHHWALRIVEEDGSVDEDFPALDRSRPMDGFQFDAFALCPTGTTPPDVPESAKAETITPLPTLRRPDPAPTAPVLAPAAAGLAGDAPAAAVPTVPAPTASGPATKLFIKVHLYSTIEVRHTTTLNVAPTTPLAQIFDAVCRKRSVNPKDYLLKLPDMQTAITDLNQPFASLGNVTELFLMKKSIGTSAGDMFLRPPGEEAPDPQTALAVAHLLPGSDLAMVLTYKKFTVLRKMPMFMGRQERVLALDGEYLHILPAENRQFFDNHVKTSSYHMSSVIACKQNKKLPAQFRLELVRAAAGALPTATAPVSTTAGPSANGAGAGSTSAGAPTSATSLPGGETKVYEFEAADSTTAAEICSQISLRVQLARPASTAGAAAAAARGAGALVGAAGAGGLGAAGMPTA